MTNDNSICESALEDQYFADAIEQICSDGKKLALVVVNCFTACLFSKHSNAPWEKVCRGDFGNKALEVAIKFCDQLNWVQVDGKPNEIDFATVNIEAADRTEMKKWVKTSDKISEREGEANAQVKELLTYISAWRCQFSGCGKDLYRHNATGRRSRSSYFAHIVAASPKGPRGSKELSSKLASDPENFLFLCDACHRLIDRTDPDYYTIDLLREMRANSVATVKQLLKTLEFPQAIPVAIIGNIAGQQGQLSDEAALEAMTAASLQTNGNRTEYFFRLGGNIHPVHEVGYWTTLFLGMQQEIIRLQSLLNSTANGGGARPRIAIFGLHTTSILVLAGRLLGDNDDTHIFQPSRNKQTSQTRWKWPSDNESSNPQAFKLETIKGHNGQRDAALLVYLTSEIPTTRLPEILFRDAEYQLPTLKISIEHPSQDCLQSSNDLNRFSCRLNDAIKCLQDEWRVSNVHLIICAPTSACIVVGQKLQARHHSDYICYEALGGPQSQFRATVQINHNSIVELLSGQKMSAQLKL